MRKPLKQVNEEKKKKKEILALEKSKLSEARATHNFIAAKLHGFISINIEACNYLIEKEGIFDKNDEEMSKYINTLSSLVEYLSSKFYLIVDLSVAAARSEVHSLIKVARVEENAAELEDKGYIPEALGISKELNERFASFDYLSMYIDKFLDRAHIESTLNPHLSELAMRKYDTVVDDIFRQRMQYIKNCIIDVVEYVNDLILGNEEYVNKRVHDHFHGHGMARKEKDICDKPILEGFVSDFDGGVDV